MNIRKAFSKMTWSGFIPNLLGVTLGIMLTFGINSLWRAHEEKNKTKEMLILVRNELETNKKWFINQEITIKADVDVYKKILETKSNWATIPTDTLELYQLQTRLLGPDQLTFSAWQIFQNSEMIQKMSDKELIIRLTDCYFWIDKIQEVIKTQYWDNKIKAIPPEVDIYKYFDALMSNKETVSFYTIMCSESFSIWNIFPFADAIIDYTIILLDKRGDYQYDMEEMDNEMNAFIESRVISVLQKMNEEKQ